VSCLSGAGGVTGAGAFVCSFGPSPWSDADGAAGATSEDFRVTRTVSFINGTLDVFFEGGVESGF